MLWPDAGPNDRVHLVGGPEGNEAIALVPKHSGPGRAVCERHPHLADLPAFTVPEEFVRNVDRLETWLRHRLTVRTSGGTQQWERSTGIQVAGVLDDLYATDHPLGIVWERGVPSFHLWAPTAHRVRLHLFETSTSRKPRQVVEMTRGGMRPGGASPLPNDRGVFSVRGDAGWKLAYYLYEVEVYAPSKGDVVTNRVTDPYSVGLSCDGRRSQVLDLDDPALAPTGWDVLPKPRLDRFEDIVLYELHVRDFSALDPETPPHLRGTYLAFTLDSTPTRHLRRLAEAGVTHVHLLPIQDFATVDEDRSSWEFPVGLEGLPPDSEEQQARIHELRGRLGYNWGYDPQHFGVPEGSYSTAPDGPARIFEVRRMVQALARLGLRVVMDVVYNHTFKCGQSPRSILDRIVPGYYHRLDENGKVTTSTCCANTASENRMMERLIGDDLVRWATQYRIDGFRFDLMGHHMKRNVVAWRDRLRSLRLDADGIDGPRIYLYGEGWDFGEVVNGKRGENASQLRMAGTGVGTFNDRIRDAVRGGSPFSDRRAQGFGTGLYHAPAFDGKGEDEKERLRELSDRLRIALSGNLREFRFVDREGKHVVAGDVYLGGYAATPTESIQYVSAHDNETLFDKVLFSTPEDMPLEDRIRMHVLSLAIILLAQGIPFLHAGSELLRSKSFDADSYRSGDWFNQLDFTGDTHGFGRGLPPAKKNADRWDILRPLLSRADLVPTREQILNTRDQIETLLRIRKSAPLFRLPDLAQIQSATTFFDQGADPGWIAYSLANESSAAHWVLFHSHGSTRKLAHPSLVGRTLQLHPLLANGADRLLATEATFDPKRGAFRIPKWSAAVFVEAPGA